MIIDRWILEWFMISVRNEGIIGSNVNFKERTEQRPMHIAKVNLSVSNYSMALALPIWCSSMWNCVFNDDFSSKESKLVLHFFGPMTSVSTTQQHNRLWILVVYWIYHYHPALIKHHIEFLNFIFESKNRITQPSESLLLKYHSNCHFKNNTSYNNLLKSS